MRTLLVVVAASGLAALGTSQSYFPDTQENHWAWEGLADVVRLKLWSANLPPEPPPVGRPGQSPIPRTIFASITADCCFNFRSRFEKRANDPDLISSSATVYDMIRDRDFYRRRWRLFLYRSLKEFAPEIKQMGQDPRTLRILMDRAVPAANAIAGKIETRLMKLGIAPLFPDLPYNHWAYDAVSSLHDMGLLKGYPDGKLRGD